MKLAAGLERTCNTFHYIFGHHLLYWRKLAYLKQFRTALVEVVPVKC